MCFSQAVARRRADFLSPLHSLQQRPRREIGGFGFAVPLLVHCVVSSAADLLRVDPGLAASIQLFSSRSFAFVFRPRLS